MKDREDFIKSVWEKSEAALVEERRRKVRRSKITGFASAAACMLLVVGMANFDNLADMYGEYLMKSSDGMTSDVTGDMSSDMSSDMMGYYSDNSDNRVEDQNVAGADAFLPPDETLKSDITGIDELRNLNISSICRISLENISTAKGITITGEEKINEYMKWFYGLTSEQALTQKEFNNLKNKPKECYKFTIERSLGEDTEENTESESLIYYILGGAETGEVKTGEVKTGEVQLP